MKESEINLIYSYSRKQALEDGVLLDVTSQAGEAGFKLPVAISDHLYHRYIVPPQGLNGEGQSTTGRMQDMFSMVKAAASQRWDGSRVHFKVLFLMQPGVIEEVECVAICGPGDDGEPVFTICLPEDE